MQQTSSENVKTVPYMMIVSAMSVLSQRSADVLTYLQSTGTVPARDDDVLLEYVPESDRHLTTDGLLGRGL